MSLLQKIEKDIKTNIRERLALFKERSTAVSKRLEKLTEEGKKKYKVFTLKMKVQDEFTKLGGKIYDLRKKKSNPFTNKKIQPIIKRIAKIEDQIKTLEKASRKKRKTTPRRKEPKKRRVA